MHLGIYYLFCSVAFLEATPIPLMEKGDSPSPLTENLQKRMKFPSLKGVFSSSGDNAASSLRGATAFTHQADVVGSSSGFSATRSTEAYPTVQDWSSALSPQNRQYKGLLSTPVEAHTTPSQMFTIQKNKIGFQRREQEFTGLQKRLAEFQKGTASFFKRKRIQKS
jgi:hypothetical protein